MSSFSSINGPRFLVGSQLAAGITKAQILPYSNSLYGGLSILNGPVQIGLSPLLTPPLGTLSVGPSTPTSGPPSLSGIYIKHPLIGVDIASPAIGFKVIAPINNITGSVTLLGLLNVTGNTTIVGNTSITGNTSVIGNLSVTGTFSAASIATINGGNGIIAGTLTAATLVSNGAMNSASAAVAGAVAAGSVAATGAVTSASANVSGNVTAGSFTGPLTGNVTGTASGNKTLASFDIPHVKEKGKRIRHIVAEGPEPGIYIRGTLKGGNAIELPEYWDGLIDPETITVTLTSVGSYQELFVDKIEWGKKVIVKNNQGSSIHCYYEIWAARWLNPMNHEDKLTVVYEGESPDDYPDGNKNFLIGGWDYDRRNTEWETPE
jgi:hypothetical protein